LCRSLGTCDCTDHERMSMLFGYLWVFLSQKEHQTGFRVSLRTFEQCSRGCNVLCSFAGCGHSRRRDAWRCGDRRINGKTCQRWDRGRSLLLWIQWCAERTGHPLAHGFYHPVKLPVPPVVILCLSSPHSGHDILGIECLP